MTETEIPWHRKAADEMKGGRPVPQNRWPMPDQYYSEVEVRDKKGELKHVVFNALGNNRSAVIQHKDGKIIVDKNGDLNFIPRDTTRPHTTIHDLRKLIPIIRLTHAKLVKHAP